MWPQCFSILTVAQSSLCWSITFHTVMHSWPCCHHSQTIIRFTSICLLFSCWCIELSLFCVAIFGQSLERTLQYEQKCDKSRKVPHIVESCVTYLRQYGLHEEGLFRLNFVAASWCILTCCGVDHVWLGYCHQAWSPCSYLHLSVWSSEVQNRILRTSVPIGIHFVMLRQISWMYFQ